MVILVTCLLLLELANYLVNHGGPCDMLFLMFNPNAVCVRVCEEMDCRDVEEIDFATVNAKMNTTASLTSFYFSSIDGTRMNMSLDHIKMCSAIPLGLIGLVNVQMDQPSEEDTVLANPEVQAGGRFQPKDCTARHMVAIIIPYRDRSQHLSRYLWWEVT
jgi:N-terminal region of glycosyl transferase group 7